MKKISLSLLVFLTSLYVTAQDFSIGPKVGLNQGTIVVNGDNFRSGENLMGYHVGAFVRMGGASIFIQPEFLFTNTGGSIIESSTNGAEVVLDANFSRLDIPMMFGFKLANFFRIQAGPVASIMLDYTLQDAAQVARDVDYRSSTIGYQAGIGLDVGNLILDFKYESALNAMSRSVAGFETDQRQNQWILSAGFRLF